MRRLCLYEKPCPLGHGDDDRWEQQQVTREHPILAHLWVADLGGDAA